MQALAPPTTAFAAKKAKILQQLALPDAEYSDASPKGSVDEGIRHLIDEINGVQGYVTTSSCAGRVSVFLEGRRTAGDGDRQVAGVGGKGAGGSWLHASHEPEPLDDRNEGGSPSCMDWLGRLGLSEAADVSEMSAIGGVDDDGGRRLIHFKFEPMILHVLTASPAHAQLLLRCALQAGFRESGAVNVMPSSPPSPTDQAMPMVAVRSMGLGLESLIGYEARGGCRRRIVQPEYVGMLLRIANQRFAENAKRIERFRSAWRSEVLEPKMKTKRNPQGGEWEDPVERRERLKAQGMKRREALQAQSKVP